MRLDLKDIIHKPDARKTFQFQADLSGLEFYGRKPITRPVLAQGSVTNHAGALVLEGTVSSLLDLVCDRCGKEFSREKVVRLDSLVAQALEDEENDDILLLDKIKKLLTPAGFSHLTVTTAEHHDEMIAYTSQMCHVISNAYVKSPRAQMHKGYSAGSYMDLTRVAWLNEHMWTDLFLENRTFLLQELDQMIGSLQEYREALEQGNGDRLCTLLAEGRICKEKVDGQ